jgi:hypothetical protein
VRSFWPASASAFLVLLAFGASAAGSSSAVSLSLPAGPSIVRADGNVVAAVVPGNRKGRCDEILLWRVGGKPKPITTIENCDDSAFLDGIDELALAGQTALWEETNGGNNLELSISKATLARPKAQDVSYVENGSGAAGDPGGDWTGSLVGHSRLLAYASWTECDQAGAGYARPCAKGVPDLYAQHLHVVGGRIIHFGPDAIFPLWTDGRAILVEHDDKTLVLLDAHGRVLWRHSAVPGLVGALFQGSQLVTLTWNRLLVWKLPRMTPVRSFPLVRAKRVLEDLDGGVAVLGSKGTTHLIRLTDGRGVTFTNAAHAQLEPQGLVFGSGSSIRFVPRSQIRFGH